MSVVFVHKQDNQEGIKEVEVAKKWFSPLRCFHCFGGRTRTRIRQQDSRWSWVICFSALIANVVSLGCPYGFGIFLPSLLVHFKQGKGFTAFVGSLTMGLIFFLGPLAGKLIEKFGCRLVAIFGGLLNALGLFLSSLVPSFHLMFFTFSILCGLGTSCVYTASFVIVPRYFRIHCSLAMGILSSGVPCAALIMSASGNALLKVFDWRDVFKIMSGVSLCICLLCLTFDPCVDDADEKTGTVKKRTTANSFKVFKSKRYVVFLFTAMVSYVGSNMPIIHLVQFSREVGVSNHKAFWPLFCLGLGSFLIRPVIGRLCDMNFVNPVYLYQSFLFLAGLSVILSGLASSFSGLVTFGFAYGLLLGGNQIMVYLLIRTSLKPQNMTSGFALFLCVISFSLAGGAPLAGYIADKTDSYKMAFYVGGTFYLLSCIIPFALRCCKHKKDNETVVEVEDATSTIAVRPETVSEV